MDADWRVVKVSLWDPEDIQTTLNSLEVQGFKVKKIHVTDDHAEITGCVHIFARRGQSRRIAQYHLEVLQLHPAGMETQGSDGK